MSTSNNFEKLRELNQKAEAGGYSHEKFFSSFIGFFPADNPEVCVAITLDEPKEGHYGGMVAGPVFRQVAERAATYLNIKPDLDAPAPGPNLATLPPARTARISEEAKD